MYSLNRISSKYEGIEVVLALDGARFTLHIAHLIHGFKVNIRVRD